MDYFELDIPTKILFGTKSISHLPKICSEFGNNILIISDKNIEQHAKKLQSIFDKNIQTTLLFLEFPEPTSSYIDTLRNNLSDSDFSCIIGFGGGSSIDTAKSLAIGLTNPEPIWEYANLSNRPPKPILQPVKPIIAIPTTSGSGSEVTPYAVITRPETKQRGTIQQKEVIPTYAIIDPEFLVTMPESVTISTALDAFAHGLESHLNSSKFSPISEWAGKEAMRLIFQNLSKVLDNPANLDLRSNLALASTLAGISILHRGTTLGHAIAETIGGLTKIPHGHCVAIATLPVLKYTISKSPNIFSDLFQNLFNSESTLSDLEKSKRFFSKVESLIHNTNFNKQVKDYVSLTEYDNFNKLILEHMLEYKSRPVKQHMVQFSNDELTNIISLVSGI